MLAPPCKVITPPGGAPQFEKHWLSLKSHLPGSVPLEYLDFCVRGKFCHLAQGNSGLIVVKGSDQRKLFEKLGLFTINLEILPHFRDLNDRTLPDHMHDEMHEDFDISECTMVKSYRFARYLQHFNKLQAECKTDGPSSRVSQKKIFTEKRGIESTKESTRSPFFQDTQYANIGWHLFLNFYHNMHQPIGIVSHDIIRVLNTPRLE
ncbi:hypothetical protein TNCV_684111 [Trichonephila clavipes]|nr:hypothetical protein TNCV_684111 [Trichonephila clavipes]